MRGRTLLVVVGAVLMAATLVPTGGFTAASADRSVQIAVVPDDEAFVSIDPANPTLDNGHHPDVELLRVHNGFGESVTVTARVPRENGTGPPPHVRDVSGPGTLAPGASGAVTADVVCASAREEGEVTVELVVTGEDVEVTMERQVEIACTGEGRGNEESETDPGERSGDGRETESA
jgi:hypothetical protein